MVVRVGSLVRTILPVEDLAASQVFFAPEMRKLLGRVGIVHTVKKATASGSSVDQIAIYFDDSEASSSWMWDERWVEEIEETTQDVLWLGNLRTEFAKKYFGKASSGDGSVGLKLMAIRTKLNELEEMITAMQK